MKKFVNILMVLLSIFITTNSLLSCEKVNVEKKDKDMGKVIVYISFSDFDYSFDEDEIATRASDKTPDEADVNRIALSVFDTNGKLVFESLRMSRLMLMTSVRYLVPCCLVIILLL